MGCSCEDRFWELAIAVNAAFKGLLGAMGQSGHICRRANPVDVSLDLPRGWSAVMAQVVEALKSHVEDGDVVVLADKVVAASLGRIAPREILLAPDPKTVGRDELPHLADRWSRLLGLPLAPEHLLLADEYLDTKATLGTDDPNRRSFDLAQAILDSLGIRVDVVISDTDTGLDIRRPLINAVTICATPLGATAGINLYEAMRCAVAAEFVRGHDRGIPIVVCKPADRRRGRPLVGTMRHYEGFLDASLEKAISHA